jgi:hypothetical protein
MPRLDKDWTAAHATGLVLEFIPGERVRQKRVRQDAKASEARGKSERGRTVFKWYQSSNNNKQQTTN